MSVDERPNEIRDRGFYKQLILINGITNLQIIDIIKVHRTRNLEVNTKQKHNGINFAIPQITKKKTSKLSKSLHRTTTQQPCLFLGMSHILILGIALAHILIYALSPAAILIFSFISSIPVHASATVSHSRSHSHKHTDTHKPQAKAPKRKKPKNLSKTYEK